MTERHDTRAEIAAAAARCIAEDGADYATAKRKAAREVLGDGDARSALPDNAQIETELRAYLRTYAAGTQPRVLAALRKLAMQLMRRLAEFQPHLVGAVLNGTATEHSDVVLHLFTDSAKDVEIFLLNEGVPFEAQAKDDSGAMETLHLMVQPARGQGMPGRVGVVLMIFERDAIRVAPRGRSSAPDLHPVEASGRANLPMMKTLLDATERCT
jgi:hypothetical protein